MEWDFIELPSQIFENWVNETESMKQFAFHVDTGEPMPDTMLETLSLLRTFMQGIAVLRQNEFTFLDFMLHMNPVPKDIEELDRMTIE